MQSTLSTKSLALTAPRRTKATARRAARGLRYRIACAAGLLWYAGMVVSFSL